MRQWHVLTCLLSLALTGVTLAGPFRRNKPDPEIHVPGLINVLKTEKDEKKRAEAADELGEFDGKAFPAIIPALLEALASDPSSSVRAEAAESIGNVRPISTKAGYALEQAVANDKALSVRVTARTSLLQYRFLGYVGAKPDASVAQTVEPPLASLTADSIRPSPSDALIRPAPTNPTAPPTSNMPLPIPQIGPREPSNNTSMFPFLNRLNPFTRTPTPAADPVVVKEKGQTGEPPISRPMAPAPKKDFQIVDDLPPVTPKAIVPPALPIPSGTKPKAALTSDPRELPDLLPKPEPKPSAAEKSVPTAPARPVLVIPVPNPSPAIQTIPNSPSGKPVPKSDPAEDGPALPSLPPPK